jgi:predicted transcriptional regulator
MRSRCCATRSCCAEAQRDWLKAEIQKGIDSAERGEMMPAGEVFDRLEAKYRVLAEKQQKGE